MNKKMQNIFLIVVTTILVLGMIRIAFFREKSTITKQPETGKISLGTTEPINDPSTARPKSVSWGVTKLDLEKKMAVYKISSQQVDDAMIEKTARSFGFEGKAEVDQESFLVYNNTENNTTLDINKTSRTIKYSKNLLVYPMIKVVRTIPVEEIGERLKDLVTKRFDLKPEIKVTVERTEYETLAGPRFVASSREKADIVKINGNYQVGGYPVYSFAGFPIIARFSTDGNLLNLSVDLAFDETSKQDSLTVKTEEELKRIPPENYKIVDIDGEKDYDMSSYEEAIGGVNITGGYLGYILTPESDYLLPYVFFKGNSKLLSGPVVVTMAVPALKEEGLYK
ncbi:MAG: hypothetical protein WC841_03965 [Candidatus Shapirobacteria bacterium]|jgi:hypothetical protein